VKFAREVQRSTQKSDDLTRVRFHAGAISEADADRIHVSKLEADQAVALAQQGLAQAKTALAFLLGVRDRAAQFEVEPLPRSATPAVLASASLEDLLRRALDNRPDLKATVAETSRAQSALKLARRLRFPDISLNLQYEQEGSSSGTTVFDPTTNMQVTTAGITPPTLQLSLTATLPIFYQQQGEIQRAQADVRAQLLGAGKVGAQILSDVAGSFAAFEGSKELVTRMETELLEQVGRVRDLVEIQYQKGAASLLEYLDAQRTYIATNVEYIQDLTAYWSAEHAIEAAVAERFK
jgi:cobalt-zinc-cadmium efflux system outer membrane protein